MKTPSSPCLSKWQYQKCIDQHWPNLVFRENQILERSILNKDLTEKDDLIFDLNKRKIRKNSFFSLNRKFKMVIMIVIVLLLLIMTEKLLLFF
jgi:hypothetical protein